MDTATITSDLKNEQNYNRALQKQVFDLQTELEELRGRLRTLEEVNNELIQQERFRARSR
jgi:predicted nuclease with TOPRIM domain